MMYVNQITMLYTLNLYSAVCQLYLNETGRGKKGGHFTEVNGGIIYKSMGRVHGTNWQQSKATPMLERAKGRSGY